MPNRVKTYKREMALLIFIWLVYLSLYGTVAVLEIVAWPSFVFILGAFGLDEINKNTSSGSRIANLRGMFNRGSSESS